MEGIRLTDIHGYNEGDFVNYVNNNMAAINSKIAANPGYTDDEIKEEMYLNSLIRNKVGNDAYDRDVRGSNFAYKKDYYNRLFADPKVSSMAGDTDSVSEQLDSELGNEPISGTNNPDLDWEMINGNVQPASMYDYFKISDVNRTYDEVPDGPRISTDQNTIYGLTKINALPASQEEKRNTNELDRITTLLYNPKYQMFDDSLINSSDAYNSVENYTSEIRQKFDDDGDLTFEFYKIFEDEMLNSSQAFKRYHDTLMMPVTPNQMKDIMARYYAIGAVQGRDKAAQYAQDTFQDIVADNQSVFAKFQNGIGGAIANCDGFLISSLGLINGFIPAAAKASMNGEYTNRFTGEDVNFEIDDASWMDEFLYYLKDDPLVKYGNNIMKTGSFNLERQRRLAQNGFNMNEILKHSNQGLMSLESTPFELMQQVGFMAGAALMGGITGEILAGTLGSAASGAAQALMRSGSTIAARATQILGDALVVGGSSLIPSIAESVQIGQDTYDNIINSNIDSIERQIQSEVQKAVDSGEFDMWFAERYPLPFVNPERHLSVEEEQEMLARYNANREKALGEYSELVKERLTSDPNYRKSIEDQAARETASTIFENTMVLLATETLFSKLFGPALRDSKDAIVRNIGKRSQFNLYRNSEGALRVAEKGWLGRTYNNVSPYVKMFAEPVSEGVQEWFQEVDQNVHQDIAGDYMSKWIENRNNPDALDELAQFYSDHNAVVNASIGRNIFSDESKYAFALAAMSSMFGQPSISSGIIESIRSGRARKNGIDFKRNGWEVANTYLRSPFIEAVVESKNQRASRKQEIDDINLWLEKHDEIAKMKDVSSILKWSEDQTNSALLDNEADYRDSVMGQKISTLIMMDRIGGSSKEISFRKRLDILSKLRYESDEAQQLINESINVNNIQNPTESDRKKIYDNIVSRAKELIGLQDDIHNIRRTLSAQFGTVLSEESIDGLVFETLMQRNLNERSKSIAASVADAWDRSSNVDTKANRSRASKEQNAVAKLGNIAEGKRQLKLLQEKLSKAKNSRADIIKEIGDFGYKHFIDGIKRDIKVLKEDIKNFNEDSESNVIRAEDISSLDAEAKAAILNDKNRKRYSQAQIEEIDRFKSADGITKEVLKSIEDAAKISVKSDNLNQRFNEYYSDARSLVAYDTDIRKRILKQYAERSLSGAMQAESYEDFKAAMDEFLMDQTHEYLFGAVPEVLKNNKFYAEYAKELEGRESSLEIMSNSPLFKSLNNSEQRGLYQAYFAATADNDTSFDNIYKHLSDPKLMSAVGLTNQDLNNEFASKIIEILKQIDNYNNTLDNLKKQKDALKGNPAAKSKDNPVPGKDTTKEKTLLSKEIYNKYKDRIDNIVGKISKHLNNVNIRVSNMSKEDFLTMLRLFGDDFGSELLIDDFKKSFNESDIDETFRKVMDALGNKRYTDPNAIKDVVYQNTEKFKDALVALKNGAEVGRKINGVKTTKQFVKQALLELNPSWNTILNPQPTKKQNVGKIGKYNILKSDELETQAEKDFYAKNDFQKNVETLSKENKTRDIRIVFVYDEKLGQDILNETGETSFNSDNLPLVSCAIVDKSTNGAILIDGTYVLPIGLTSYSRDIPALEEVNTLNVLRQLAIDRNQTGIIKNADNTTYICEGITLHFSKQTEEGGSNSILRDMLIDKHNGDRAEALDDFKNGIVECHLSIDRETNMVGGWYFYNGTRYTFEYPKPENSWNEDGADSHPINVYIDSEHPDQPYFLFSRRFTDERLDENGTTIYSLLSDNSDLRNAGVIERFDLNNIVKAVEHISNEIRHSINDIKRSKDFSDKISASITKVIDKNHINLARKYQERTGSISLQFDMDGNNLKAYVINDFYPDNDPNHKIEVASLDVSTKRPSSDYYIFAKQTIRGLIFDDDGKIRLNPTNGESLVKLQVSDAKARGSDPDARNYQESIFNAGSYYYAKLHNSVKVSGVSVNETIQHKASDTGNKVQDSINDLEYFKKRKSDTGSSSSVITVSQFINSEEDFEKLSLANKVAVGLRQSFAKLVKTYFETGKSYDSIKEWMIKNNIATWPGIGGAGNAELPMFINQQLSKIDKFFESRGETVVTGDLLFSEQVFSENGKSVKLNATPDLVTVDKSGKYHIYDISTIQFSRGSIKSFDGFNNPTIILNGARVSDEKINKWSQRLSLEQAIMNRALGAGRVASIGVLPIIIDYNLTGGAIIGAKTFDVIGNNVHNVEVDQDGKTVNLHVNISDESMPKNGNKTYTVSDAIQINAIKDLSTISSDLWEGGTTEIQEDGSTKELEQKPEHYIDGIPTQAPIVKSVSRSDGLIKSAKFKPTIKKTDMIKEKKNINEC